MLGKMDTTNTTTASLEKNLCSQVESVRTDLQATKTDFKEMIDLQGAQISGFGLRFAQVEAELEQLKAHTDAGPTSFGSSPQKRRCADSAASSQTGSSRASTTPSMRSNFSSARASTEAESYWQGVSRGSEKTNVARLTGFPFKYGKDDLLRWGEEQLSFMKDKFPYVLQAGGSAKSVRVEFGSSALCAEAIQYATTIDLKWMEDESDDVSECVSLRLTHDSSNELRNMGGLLSVAWRATSEAIGNIASDLDTSHTLITDRKAGKLMLVHRKRVSDLFYISPPIHGADAQIKVNPVNAGWPVWMTAEITAQIVSLV